MEGLTPLEAVAKMKGLLDVARDKFEPYKYYSENDTLRKDLKERLDNAQSDYNTAVRWLQLETNLAAAETRLDKTMKDYEKLLKGPDPDQVETADARIKAAEANLAAAQANLDNLELKATIAGTVVKNDLVVGQNVAAGVPAITLADFSEIFAETDDLTEIEVVDVAIGQEVTVVADALARSEIERRGREDQPDFGREARRYHLYRACPAVGDRPAPALGHDGGDYVFEAVSS